MEAGSIGIIAISATVLALIVATFNHFLGPAYDPKEPPVIRPKLPYIGHIIGLMQYGLRYFENLSTKHPLPIFTLQTLGMKVYVVNSPDLIQAVQKHAKALSFNPFVSFMSPRIFGCGKEATALINENIDGNWGYLSETAIGMHAALAPSESLDWMTKTMLDKLMDFVDPLAASKSGTELNLYKWVRSVFTVSSTEATYGPKNPFNHVPDLEDAFWDFESDFTMILLGVAPSITARKGYQARIRFINAMDKYFAECGPETGSDLIRARWKSHHDFGGVKYAGAFEIGNLIGVLINATPTFFWMLVHIFSRPDLLAELRAEISGVTDVAPTEETTTTTAQAGTKKKPQQIRRIVVSKLKEHCPLLLSLYQETLRVQTHNTSSRWVIKDTLLADRYLLKAGNVIQMPGYPVHMMPAIYGADAETFKPRRFIKLAASTDGKKDRAAKQHPASFRSFGGGATLCPGRHFATAELCAATAMFVMQFDMRPADGPWEIPDWAHGKLASSVPPPERDVRVRVSRREEDVEWRFGFEGSISKFEVLSG
ncbi:MAG: hypothetical protein LQ344_006937 [Seirophora lacunosa]|nr:MAG: hypothetical protein LQ344_006937 [Seirophora lacunosa]